MSADFVIPIVSIYAGMYLRMIFIRKTNLSGRMSSSSHKSNVSMFERSVWFQFLSIFSCSNVNPHACTLMVFLVFFFVSSHT